MTKKIGRVGEASWIIGNILCAIGNCLVSKSEFGLSPIIAPAFVINDFNNKISVGNSELFIQGALLLLCCILIGKFKGKFIATICNIIFYSTAFDTVDYLFSFIVPETIFERILAAVIGTIITSFAIALMLRTYIPPSSYEIFVKEVADAKGINVNKMKLIFDASMLALTFILMFALLGEYRFDIIGPLTVISAFLNSSLIGFFGKLLDKKIDFTPAIPKLYEILNPNEKK